MQVGCRPLATADGIIDAAYEPKAILLQHDKFYCAVLATLQYVSKAV